MRGIKARLILVPALVMAVAACSSDSKKDTADPNIFPADYKQEILNTLSRTLDDPTNVRDAAISDPALSGGKEQRYTVCVRFNPRNAARQYTGSSDRIAYFFGGRLNQLVEATKEQCGKAPYKPFPELEKLCQAKVCN
jgi:hypothetical protein